MKKFKLTDAQIQKGKDLIDKETIETFIIRAEENIKKGNINFNYKIALLPVHLADYIIVHELCHLGQFNHSQKFWNLVAKTFPNYLEIRKELKNIRIGIY